MIKKIKTRLPPNTTSPPKKTTKEPNTIYSRRTVLEQSAVKLLLATHLYVCSQGVYRHTYPIQLSNTR